MISERLLRKWRKEALKPVDEEIYEQTAPGLAEYAQDQRKRILKMTQILLDQHLLNKE